ncbi:MAG: biopolymer transporter ExbD [Planctomycetes bacterium]|nr:biopolymer transporter ExbD [Planctomycetota bacterium]
MKLNMPQLEEPELGVTPLIDMTFLLLVYFMATCSLNKSEGDLGIRLPGALAQAQSVDLPDEQIIEVTETGRIFLNGREYDSAVSQDLPGLFALLVRYKQAADAGRTEAMVTIAAQDMAKHQRVIDVMNCCAGAGITNVTFSAAVQ